MTSTRLLSICIIFLNLLLLSSCSNLFEIGDRDLDHHQICNDIKRKLIYFQSSPNHEVQWSSPGKRAELLQDFQRFNCRNVLEHPDE